MSFPRYPAYKDSGVEWLGEVPEHWEIDRLKRVLEIKKATVGANSGDYVLLSLTLQGVIPRDLENPMGKFPAEFDTYQAVEPADLVFCLFDVEETPRAVGISEYHGMVTGAYTVARTLEGFRSNFLHYYYLSRDQYKAFKMYYTGLRNVIRKETFLSIPCPLPPLDEQSAISNFLDRETAKIDALVAEQGKLIALLQEKRQAVISHAVTKGLDPDVPMKDSGVEWLGEVPAHWGVKSLRYVLNAIGDVDHFMPPPVDIGIPYLMTGDLKDFVSEVSLEDCKQVSRHDFVQLSKKIRTSKGDVVMARYATIGTSMYVDVDQDILVSYSCVTLKTNPSEMSGMYLFQYMKSDPFRRGIEHQVNTNTQGNVGIKDLQGLKIAVPPFGEQSAIVAFLQHETSKIDCLTAEANLAIDLLRERRAALISAAVTGQIDVRSAVEEAA